MAHLLVLVVLNCSLPRRLAGWEDVSRPINTAVSTSLQLEWQLPTDSQAYFKQGGNFFVKSRDDGTPIRLSDADVRLQLQIKLILHSAPGFTDDGTDCRRVAGACGSMEFGWVDTNANNVQDATEATTFRSESFKIWGALAPTPAPSLAPASSVPTPTPVPTDAPASAAPSPAPATGRASSVPTQAPATVPTQAPATVPTQAPASGGPTPAPTGGPIHAGDTPAPSAARERVDPDTTSTSTTARPGDDVDPGGPHPTTANDGDLVVDGTADANTAASAGAGDWWIGVLIVVLLALLFAVLVMLYTRRRSRDRPKEVLYADPEAGRTGFERANAAYGGSGVPLFNTADLVASRPDGVLQNDLYQGVSSRGGCTVNPQYAVPTRPVPMPYGVGATKDGTGPYTDVAPHPAEGVYGEVTPFVGGNPAGSGPYNAQLSDDQLYDAPASPPSPPARAMDNGLYADATA